MGSFALGKTWHGSNDLYGHNSPFLYELETSSSHSRNNLLTEKAGGVTHGCEREYVVASKKQKLTTSTWWKYESTCWYSHALADLFRGSDDLSALPTLKI
ncbi:hypothetical protein E2P81_ATG04669 [Venturia nashicola]|nr:hypothetical protein E2P81_ATG04669 [Venturia nashicola]